MMKWKFVLSFMIYTFVLQSQEHEPTIFDISDSYSPELNAYVPIERIQYPIEIPFENVTQTKKAIDHYRIKIGDVFRIAIYGEDQSIREASVSPAGDLTYLFPEPFPAMGKTIFELREEMERRLKQYYRYPYLSITPIAFAGEYYTIIGEVNSPGTKLIEGNPTLLSALCDARGFTMNTFQDHYFDYSDMDSSFIARKGEYLPVDFKKLLTEGDMSQDVLLQAGDYIYINHRQVYKIYVLGEVVYQQTYDYLTKVTLMEVLAESSGTTLQASSRVFVIRGSLACPTQYYIDINLIQKGCAPDFPLEPGDIVYVPPRNFSFLRLVYQSAMRNFVSVVASDAGNTAFIQITPDAAGTSGPISTITVGTGVTAPATTGGAAQSSTSSGSGR